MVFYPWYNVNFTLFWTPPHTNVNKLLSQYVCDNFHVCRMEITVWYWKDQTLMSFHSYTWQLLSRSNTDLIILDHHLHLLHLWHVWIRLCRYLNRDHCILMINHVTLLSKWLFFVYMTICYIYVVYMTICYCKIWKV